MTLRNRAVLTMTVDGNEGEFHLMHAEPVTELNREFLMSNRGQAISDAIDILPGDQFDGGQEGFFLDAGQGTDTITLSFEGGGQQESYDGVDVQWGDGSSGTDRFDATGAHPDTQAQVLRWWARNTTTDSFRSQAELHWGEWTDGSINGSTGIFGEPITVAISSVRTERSGNDPSAFDGTVELIRASSLTSLDNENNAANALSDR